MGQTPNPINKETGQNQTTQQSQILMLVSGSQGVIEAIQSSTYFLPTLEQGLKTTAAFLGEKKYLMSDQICVHPLHNSHIASALLC